MEGSAVAARGRPRKEVPLDLVIACLNSRMTYKQIGEMLQARNGGLLCVEAELYV